MDGAARRAQRVVQLAQRLLARADHDVVHVEHPGLAVEGQVQAGVVDAFIGHPRMHRDAARLQRRAVDPARGLAQLVAHLGAYLYFRG